MLQDNVTLNCNQTLSPWKDGDHESERVPTGESDGECSGREAERTRSLPPAATESTPGAAPQTPLSARFPGLGAARQSRTLHALGGFQSPEAVDLEPGPRQVPGLQRFSSRGKTSCRGEPRGQPRDRAPHLAGRETGVSPETPASPIPLPSPAPPTLGHDGAYRCQ